MRERIRDLLGTLTWAQRFLIVSLLILVAGMAGIGWWVGQQIESGVVHQTAANTALFVSSIVEPNLQELAEGDSITPEHQAMLARLLQENQLGQHITAVKVWDKQGRVVYATDAAAIGKVYPIDSNLMHALRGWVASDISNVDQPENVNDSDRGQRRLETYSPVRRTGSDEVIAAIEFYQTVDSLDRDIAAAQRNSWLIVGAATIVMYLLLAGFVRYASDTIRHQQNELSSQVVQLRALLKQNEQLHERVRRAARRTTALNERFLRRISAELHDGPAQDLGFALLRLEHLLPRGEMSSAARTPVITGQSDFQLVQSSLRHALQEIRAISAGMGLPELENVTLAETIRRAVRAHERRTSTQVDLELNDVPEAAPLPAKITVYRIIQEALSNAYRHANGAHQQVQVDFARNQLNVIISDQGPGFDGNHEGEWDEHLGLAGMRERVESLGGAFRIESEKGRGTRVIA
ncbi:MAG TPA: sensor histidine kinase, partial [Anaerolineae bacterium]|nr:sensor histidine kinase [Anaerolineae bacterium]